MQQKIILSFFFLLIFFNTKSQTCVGGSSTSNVPTKCFEIESILVDACDGSNEGRNEMVRLRIGPNPIAVNSIGVAPYSNVAPNQTVNWGPGASANIFRGFSNITTIPSILAKIITINAVIAATGNCGKLIPLNANGTIPAGVNLLLITSIPNGISETGPLPAFEAILSGVPVIGTPTGNFAKVPGPKFTTIEEGVNIVTYLKYNPDDMKALAKEQYDYVIKNFIYEAFAHKWKEAIEYVYNLSKDNKD
jgi:hypothetical protein